MGGPETDALEADALQAGKMLRDMCTKPDESFVVYASCADRICDFEDILATALEEPEQPGLASIMFPHILHLRVPTSPTPKADLEHRLLVSLTHRTRPFPAVGRAGG